MSSENMLQTDIIVAQENSPTNSKKRKAGSQYTHDDVPAILDFLENSLDKEDKKMLKRVKHYIKTLENKNATLENQQKSLSGEIELPPNAKPLVEKYSESFTTRNQGREALEWILRLVMKEAMVRFDFKEKETKLSKVAFYDRKDNFVEKGFNKVDRVLMAVTKKKKVKTIATVKEPPKVPAQTV